MMARLHYYNHTTKQEILNKRRVSFTHNMLHFMNYGVAGATWARARADGWAGTCTPRGNSEASDNANTHNSWRRPPRLYSRPLPAVLDYDAGTGERSREGRRSPNNIFELFILNCFVLHRYCQSEPCSGDRRVGYQVTDALRQSGEAL